MGRDNLLFSQPDLRSALEAAMREMKNLPQEMPGPDVLRLGVEAVASQLVADYQIMPLVIYWDAAYATQPRDVNVDVRYDPMRFIEDKSRPFYWPGTQVTYVVPFEGDPRLFRFRTSSWSSGGPPAGIVKGNEIHLTFEHAHPVPEGYFPKQFEESRAAIEKYAGWAAADVAQYHRELPAVAKAAAIRRHEKVSAESGAARLAGGPSSTAGRRGDLDVRGARHEAARSDTEDPGDWANEV